MSHPSGTARDVQRWLVMICSVFGALGCGKSMLPPSPSNPLPDGVISDTLDFQHKIAAFRASPDSHDRQRKAKCFLSLCSRIDVRIEAMGNTSEIDPRNAPPHGLPVAHLHNYDKKRTERFFGLLPGAQAEYYLWVDRKPGGSNQARWTLLQVSHTSNSITAAVPADLNLCHLRKPGAKPISDADFIEDKYHDEPCDVSLAAAGAKMKQSSLFSSLAFSTVLAHVVYLLQSAFQTEGGWIDCNNGCCT
jgi:hypothetical protein